MPTKTKNQALHDTVQEPKASLRPPAEIDDPEVAHPGSSASAIPSDVGNGEGSPGPRPAAISSNSLYSITRTLHELEAAVIEANGELSPALEERISTATIAREKKVDAYAAILARCESIDAEYSAQADLLKNVARGAVQLAKRLKDNLKEAMRQLDVVDLAGERVRFRLQNSKPKTIVFDETALPLEFKTRVVSLVPDLDKISKAIADGVEVPGARLEAKQSLNKYAPKKEIK